MPDPVLARFAQVLVQHCTRVRERDLVAIGGQTVAAPLVREVYRAVLEAGAFPMVRVGLDGFGETLFAYGSDEQVAWVSPVRRDEIERIDVQIAIGGDRNTRALSRVDPARQAVAGRSLAALRGRYLERAAAGKLRWVLTAYPTQAAAQDADMSLADYEQFVYRAAFLDDDDPAGRWRAFEERLTGLARFLETKDEVRIVGDGTDLTLGIGGRIWSPSGGRENFPDGEVYTAPVETRVDGTIRFTYPGVFQRREVHDVRLRFEGGEVVEATAARGQDFLRQMIAMDDGARRAGEFAFGLNYEIGGFTKNILFDEKIGGTVHLALGQSYPETGGLNRSGLHWDLICDLREGGEAYVDGELVHRGGRFLGELF